MDYSGAYILYDGQLKVYIGLCQQFVSVCDYDVQGSFWAWLFEFVIIYINDISDGVNSVWGWHG